MALIFVPGAQFFDSNGRPCASGSLTFYDTGTTNAKAVYSDPDLSVEATNPYSLDSSGRIAVNIYGSGSYTVILKTSTGATVWSRDEVFGWSGGEPYYERTAAEIAAGVVPTDYSKPPGWVTRFGANTTPGTTDMTTAMQNCIDSHGGMYLPPGTYAFAGITLPSLGWIESDAMGKCTLSYTGSGIAIAPVTPGARAYSWRLREFVLTDAGTGTVGISMDSISSASLINVQVVGFTTGVDVYSPTSGYAVYNRFYNVLSQCATGFKLRGASSNANLFVGCRTNLATTRGIDISDSNDNDFISCQFESGGAGTAVYIAASLAGVSDANNFYSCRVENYTGGVGFNISSANVRDTQIVAPYITSTVTTPLSDSGTRTQITSPASASLPVQMTSGYAATSGPAFSFTRTVQGGSNVAAVKISDTNTGGGTPTTLEINTERSTGHLIRGMRGAAEQFGVLADGKIRTNQTVANVATPSGATARAFPIYNESGTLLGYIPVYAAQWV